MKETTQKQNSLAVILFVSLLILLFVFLLYQSSDKSLSGKAIAAISDTCNGQVLFKLSDLSGRHLEVYDGTNYTYKVCAPAAWGGSRECDGSNAILRLSRETNAHAERYDVDTIYPDSVDICFEGVNCHYNENNTPCLDAELCVGSLSRNTSAHFGNCSNSDYPIKICCAMEECPEGGIKRTYYVDLDGDGYGKSAKRQACAPAGVYTAIVSGDCDDDNFDDPEICRNQPIDCFDASFSKCARCIYPGAAEVCDGVKNNCSKAVIDEGLRKRYYNDSDRDGMGKENEFRDLCSPEAPFDTQLHGDCDDNDPLYNCTIYYKNQDGDNYGLTADIRCLCSQSGLYNTILPNDCDDSSSSIYPGAQEICEDETDNDCDLLEDYDDWDDCVPCVAGTKSGCSAVQLFGVCLGANRTCNDLGKWPVCGVPEYNYSGLYEPSVETKCDGLDNDCDNKTDEGLKSRYYRDSDEDDYGLVHDFMDLCSAMGAYRTKQFGDYDDNTADDPAPCSNTNQSSMNCNNITFSRCAVCIHPGAAEVCDYIDNNCNNYTDEGVSTIYYYDFDKDGYGNATNASLCLPTGLFTANRSGDCNDNNNHTYPGASEDCNDDLDNQCPGDSGFGSINEGCPCVPGDIRDCGTDDGVCMSGKQICLDERIWGSCNGTGFVGWRNETCDGLDNDCDGQADEAWPELAASCTKGTGACAAQGVFICNVNGSGTECNAVPGSGSIEICDGLDNDCDGTPDNNLAAPAAAKTQGVCQNSVKACSGPNGWAEPNYSSVQYYQSPETDCGDSRDNDCDGKTDNDDEDCKCSAGQTKLCSLQSGVCSGAMENCTATGSWPGCSAAAYSAWNSGYQATESSCDGKDNDCDGEVDEGVKITYYYDFDDDGYGVSSDAITVCADQKPGYYVIRDGDCDDADDGINPGEDEICDDDEDNDCDGDTDGQDDDCPCEEGDAKRCGTDTGECTRGWQVCSDDYKWGSCNGTMPVNEICDNKDNNCNGKVDEIFDIDKDGFTNCSLPYPDCNDLDASIYPGASEVCGDGIDQNCDGGDKSCPSRTAGSGAARATCVDGIRNQGEADIDCGGPCPPCESTGGVTVPVSSGRGQQAEDLDESRHLSGGDAGAVERKFDWGSSIWFILAPFILVVVVLGGIMAYIIYSRKSEKSQQQAAMQKPLRTMPTEQQLAMDIWTKLYRGVPIDRIKAEYAADGIPPETVRRALVDFYMAEDAEKKKIAARKLALQQKEMQQKNELGQISKSLEADEKPEEQGKKKEDVFEKLKEKIEEEENK